MQYFTLHPQPDHTTSHQTTPHYTTLHHDTPHYTTPHHTTLARTRRSCLPKIPKIKNKKHTHTHTHTHTLQGAVRIPVIASSGAGSVAHFLELFRSTQGGNSLSSPPAHLLQPHMDPNWTWPGFNSNKTPLTLPATHCSGGRTSSGHLPPQGSRAPSPIHTASPTHT